MKKEKIDELIVRALDEEESQFYRALDEQSIPGMVRGLFEGRLRWINLMSVVVMLALFAFGVYCIYQFLTISEIIPMVRWGMGVFFCFAAVGMLKLWQFMQMDKNAILRELKRVELQVSLLSRQK